MWPNVYMFEHVYVCACIFLGVYILERESVYVCLCVRGVHQYIHNTIHIYKFKATRACRRTCKYTGTKYTHALYARIVENTIGCPCLI
jgi:hypothetical protein